MVSMIPGARIKIDARERDRREARDLFEILGRTKNARRPIRGKCQGKCLCQPTREYIRFFIAQKGPPIISVLFLNCNSGFYIKVIYKGSGRKAVVFSSEL